MIHTRKNILCLLIAASVLLMAPGPLFASEPDPVKEAAAYDTIRAALAAIRYPFSCLEPILPREGARLNNGQKRLMINDMADYEGCVATEWHNAADARAEARDQIIWAMRDLPGDDPHLAPLRHLLPRLDEFEEAMAGFVDEAVMTRGRLLAVRLSGENDADARAALIDHIRGTAVILDARDRLSFLAQALSHTLGRCDGLFKPVQESAYGFTSEAAADFNGDGVADLVAIEGNEIAKQLALYLSGAADACPPHLVVSPDIWPANSEVEPHIEFTRDGPVIIVLRDQQPWKVMRFSGGAPGPLEDFEAVLEELSAQSDDTDGADIEQVEGRADAEAIQPPPVSRP